MRERWRVIKRWPTYQVSDRGRVRRKDTRRIRKLQVQSGTGYLTVRLTRPGGEYVTLAVHVAVAEAFLPPRPTPNHMVNHKDANRANPHFDNLEWLTGSQNIKHGYDHGHCDARGSRNGHSKLTEDRVHRLRAAGRPEYEQLAEEFGITVATIHDVVARRTWSHI